MATSSDFNNQQVQFTQVKTTKDFRLGRTMAKLTTTALTSSSNAIAMDCSLSDDFTHTPTESTTITPSNIQANQLITFNFLTSGTNSYTITFGSPFHSTGTLASGASDGKTFIVVFKGNSGGTAAYEVSRTTAQS